jgi:hypothetical protein
MWNYACSTDETRVSKYDVAEDYLKKIVRRLTTLTVADEVPITCQSERFDKDHPCLWYNLSIFLLSFLLFFVISPFIYTLYLSGPSLPIISSSSS